MEGRALRVEQTTRALVSMVTTRPQIAGQVSCSVLFLYKIIPFPIIYCHNYVVILFLQRLTFVLETLVPILKSAYLTSGVSRACARQDSPEQIVLLVMNNLQFCT